MAIAATGLVLDTAGRSPGTRQAREGRCVPLHEAARGGLPHAWLPPISFHWGVVLVPADPDALLRCQQLITKLVPPPYRIDDMIDLAQRVQRRTVRLVQQPVGRCLSAVLLDLDTEVMLLVDPRIAVPQLRHVVAHQLGHLLLEHRGDPDGTVCAITENSGRARLRAGTAINRQIEYEADLFATLLLSGRPFDERTVGPRHGWIRRARDAGGRVKAAYLRGYALVGW